MPRSIKQNENMREATRTAVLDSALMLFARQGYANTSTREIAKNAGISTGLMYHYFDSKESLLRSVFENCMATLSKTLTAAYENSAPEARLANLLRAMFEVLAREATFWSFFFMMRAQPAIMDLLIFDFRQWTERLRRLFEIELGRLGRIDPEIDSLMLYSLVEGTIQQYLLNPNNYPLDRIVEQIITQLGHQRHA